MIVELAIFVQDFRAKTKDFRYKSQEPRQKILDTRAKSQDGMPVVSLSSKIFNQII